MSYVLPNFNLDVNVWRVLGAGGNYAAPDAIFQGNLTPGRRVMMHSPPGGPLYKIILMELLLPAGTDIRAAWNGLDPDLVECPAGSKRFYFVGNVDDIGKGFGNEHRIAWMFYNPSGATIGATAFPAPVPLP